MQIIEGGADARGFRFALVVSRYHDFVTDRLRNGALRALASAGVADRDIGVVVVPGSFEIPAAARRVADSGRYDAVICLGCLIRGETVHFEYIAAAVSQGIQAAAVATGVPMTFGVLTTHSVEQALDRAGDSSTNKGYEAAMAAVEMATLFRGLQPHRSPGIRV
jgi:6,7-dimethyl-8-ribityllumazine synthase